MNYWITSHLPPHVLHPELAAKDETLQNEGQGAAPNDVLPFASYPHNGRTFLGRVKGSTCRRGYGLQFMKVTGQTSYAYCGMDFAGDYYGWLQMTLDHVVPASTGKAKGIPEEWLDDSASKVLACAACNGFQVRYRLAEEEPRPTSIDEYFDLRDRVFTARKKLVGESHEKELEYFRANVQTIK